MADYDFRPGGSLKFKGGVAEGGIVKKYKKSKSKAKPDDVKELDRERVKELLLREDNGSAPGSASGSNRASPSLSNGNDRKTEAERRFEEAQRRRVTPGESGQDSTQTHKDRVNEFNSKLESLSEHHDIPKVGPG
ncbi:DUF1754-domain-containing protein [Boletus edulis]|nr:DUF1754-domain-containing protein [Boletus edulis]